MVYTDLKLSLNFIWYKLYRRQDNKFYDLKFSKYSAGGETDSSALSLKAFRFFFRIQKYRKMNRDITEITELALANLLDLIQLISNTGEEVDPIIIQIYERNLAVIEQN